MTQCDDPIDDGVQWTCPYCDDHRVIRAGSEDVERETLEERAQHALRGHVHARDGDGHGARREFPEDFDPTELDRHLEEPTA